MIVYNSKKSIKNNPSGIFSYKIAFLLCAALMVSIFATPAACYAGIVHLDGEDGTSGKADPCPIPSACKKSDNTIDKQDNGLHNSMQELHGAKDRTVNLIIKTPGDDTTPPTYDVAAPPDYTGVSGSYQYNGGGVPYASPPPTP